MLPARFPLTDPPRGTVKTDLAPGVEAVRLGIADGAAELVALARRAPNRTQNRSSSRCSMARVKRTPRICSPAPFCASSSAAPSKTSSSGLRRSPRRFTTSSRSAPATPTCRPALLQALMREESTFNPLARSHVGALGLTQLMPKTAFALAREIGAPLHDLKQLLEPDTNLTLGAKYIGQMLTRFKGESAYAAAAYNGGPTASRTGSSSAPTCRSRSGSKRFPSMRRATT